MIYSIFALIFCYILILEDVDLDKTLLLCDYIKMMTEYFDMLKSCVEKQKSFHLIVLLKCFLTNEMFSP